MIIEVCYEKNKKSIITIIIIIIVIGLIRDFIEDGSNHYENYEPKQRNNSQEFVILSSYENKPLESVIKKYTKKNKIDAEFVYKGDIDIVKELNANSSSYDAVWISNSIWLYMLDNAYLTSDSKSISISPVVLEIRKSKAESLNLIDKDITNNEILKLIQDKKISYVMNSVTATNTGATAYFGFINALAGNPEVLTKDMIDNEKLQKSLKSLFSGVERVSGDEDFLQEIFVNNDKYEAVIADEYSLIDINKTLASLGKEELYLLYPSDGVPINDSTFAFINNGLDKEVFLGNPGTGKTTVARMIANILYNLKYIRQNKLIEVSSKDLVAEYVGQTAPKTMDVVNKALGGILFVDEAYALASRDEENSYNTEAIATLIKAMEDYRDDLVAIFAGYTKEMQDFLDPNSGIVSRIGYTFTFEDYTNDELKQIFSNFMTKSGFIINDDALEEFNKLVNANRSMKNFGNARFARTVYEKTVLNHASNTKNNKSKKILKTITKDDISY